MSVLGEGPRDRHPLFGTWHGRDSQPHAIELSRSCRLDVEREADRTGRPIADVANELAEFNCRPNVEVPSLDELRGLARGYLGRELGLAGARLNIGAAALAETWLRNTPESLRGAA